MHTVVAAALRVGAVIYARGHYQEITGVQYSTPREGLITFTTTEGELPPIGANVKVTASRLTSK